MIVVKLSENKAASRHNNGTHLLSKMNAESAILAHPLSLDSIVLTIKNTSKIKTKWSELKLQLQDFS